MQPQRGTMTEHLADVIHIIHIGCKSGTLKVERGEGQTFEEGLITFIDGQAIDARVNQQNGMAAFNYLTLWRTCYFSFVSNTGPPSSPVSQTMRPPQKNTISQSGSARNTPSRPLTPVNQANSPFPIRLPRGEEALHQAENIQLPRNHRRLLLLINGQRNASELGRLMARNLDEVKQLLYDLEQNGLIRQ